MNALSASELDLREWLRQLCEKPTAETVQFASTNILIAFRQKDAAIAQLRKVLVELQEAKRVRLELVRP